MKRRLLATLCLALATTALPGIATATPANTATSTDPAKKLLDAVPGLTPEVLALMRTQENLDRLGQSIQDTARKTPASGFTSVIVDAERNTLTVYWHGPVPGPVTAAIATAQAQGAAVVVRSALYSEAQLAAEVSRIMRLPLRQSATTGRRVMSATPRPDGTGIDVTVGGLPAGTTTAQARRLVPALAADSDIPRSVTIADIAPANRWVDANPYWGGSFVTLYNNGQPANFWCSTAFGVTGNNGAGTYLLTAAHCGEGEWRSGFVVAPDGSIFQKSYGSTIPGRDLLRDGEAILISGGARAGDSVYVGRPVNVPAGDPGSDTGVGVGDASGTLIGDRLCTSGSLTGTVCDVLVSSVSQLRYDPPENGVGFMPAMINAIHATDAAVGNGDSGGPVFAIRGDGKVSARGIISGMSLAPADERPCPGWQLEGRRCSRSVWFGDIRNVLNTIGVHININPN